MTAFAAQFAQIRRRRRIPMRLFTERARLTPSYIHDVEKGALLPSREKLDLIVSVIREVAVEQGAADPDADGRALYRHRDRTLFIERLGVEPALGEIFVALRDLDEQQLADLAPPLQRAVELFGQLDAQERQGVTTLIQDVLDLVAEAEGDEQRRHRLVELATAMYSAVETVGELTSPQELAEQ